jgi:tetratricopeptide (TPR) repeat protein
VTTNLFKRINWKSELTILLLLGVFSISIRLPYVCVPFERDEGIYAYVAREMSGGSVLYRDYLDNKPPGIFYLYGLAFKLFGESVPAVHFFMHLYTIVTILVFYFFVKAFWGAGIAGLSSFIFSITTIDPSVWGSAANAEIFMLLPIVAGMYFLLKADKNTGRLMIFLSGISIGAAIMIKQVALIYVLMVMSILFIANMLIEKMGLAKTIKISGYFLAGATAAGVLFSIKMFSNGSFGEFLKNTLSSNVKYVSSTYNTGYFPAFISSISRIFPKNFTFYTLAVVSIAGLLINRKKKENAVLLLWLLFSVASVCASGYFFYHYYILLCPVIAIMSSKALFDIGGLIHLDYRKAGTALLVLAAFLPWVFFNYKYWFKYNPEGISKTMYKDYPFVESRKVGEYIRDNSRKDDYVYVLGSEPEIYFYSKTKCPVKYLFTYNLFDTVNDAAEQEWVVNELIKKKPEFMVFFKSVALYNFNEKSEDYIFTLIDHIVEKYYTLAGTVEIGDDTSIYNFNLKNQGNFWGDIKSWNEIRVFRKKTGVQWKPMDAKAIELDPEFAVACSNSGIIYRIKDVFKRSLECFNRSIELNPRYPAAYVNRGILYGMSGNMDKSIADFNRAIGLDPLNTEAYRNRGYAFQLMGKKDLAQKDFLKATGRR